MDSYFASVVNLHFCWLRSSLKRQTWRFCTVFALPIRTSEAHFVATLFLHAWQPFQALLSFASTKVFPYCSTTKRSMNYAFICIKTNTRLCSTLLDVFSWASMISFEFKGWRTHTKTNYIVIFGFYSLLVLQWYILVYWGLL